MNAAFALVRAWLVLDFFGDARRAGKGHTSTLTTTIFAPVSYTHLTLPTKA